MLSAANETVVDEQALLDGVAGAGISYFDGIDWLDYWDSATSTSLPTAIKFSLIMARDTNIRSNPAPIELIVPVLVKTTATAQQEATDAEGTQ
jgi:hypothetical protein